MGPKAVVLAVSGVVLLVARMGAAQETVPAPTASDWVPAPMDAAVIAYEEVEPDETPWAARLTPWYRARTRSGGLSLRLQF